jgi:hypothetical protein
MYGAVHHQGDVYHCTLDAIPFLVRLAAAFDLPGRDKVVELLASIGGVNFDASPNRDQDRNGSDDDGRCFDEANRLVAAEHALLVHLLGDDDPLVRAAAAGAVVVARERPSTVVAGAA